LRCRLDLAWIVALSAREVVVPLTSELKTRQGLSALPALGSPAKSALAALRPSSPGGLNMATGVQVGAIKAHTMSLGPTC